MKEIVGLIVIMLGIIGGDIFILFLVYTIIADYVGWKKLDLTDIEKSDLLRSVDKEKIMRELLDKRAINYKQATFIKDKVVLKYKK